MDDDLVVIDGALAGIGGLRVDANAIVGPFDVAHHVVHGLARVGDVLPDDLVVRMACAAHEILGDDLADVVVAIAGLLLDEFRVERAHVVARPAVRVTRVFLDDVHIGATLGRRQRRMSVRMTAAHNHDFALDGLDDIGYFGRRSQPVILAHVPFGDRRGGRAFAAFGRRCLRTATRKHRRSPGHAGEGRALQEASAIDALRSSTPIELGVFFFPSFHVSLLDSHVAVGPLPPDLFVRNVWLNLGKRYRLSRVKFCFCRWHAAVAPRSMEKAVQRR